jgi:4-hydroxy-3-methylbut-2-enyl diphosphate reductase
VELAIEKHGTPVYVRHEIVHNRYVVEDLERKGAVFVEELDEVPENVPVVFSAHGVPKSVFADAEKREMYYLDATCPLVTKVHVDATRHEKEGKDLILIGHAGHPEVIGTMGQLSEGEMILVESAEQARILKVPDPANLAFVTQTTLSVADTSEIISILQRRFPSIEAPRKEDICYATTNRQAAVRSLADECEAMIVLGAPNSSNSNRLAEVALTIGCPKSTLIQRAAELEDGWLDDVSILGITAGASAPEILVQELIESLSIQFDLDIEERNIIDENVTFRLPSALNA